jgi:hypothetical protein
MNKLIICVSVDFASALVLCGTLNLYNTCSKCHQPLPNTNTPKKEDLVVGYLDEYEVRINLKDTSKFNVDENSGWVYCELLVDERRIPMNVDYKGRWMEEKFADIVKNLVAKLHNVESLLLIK